MAIKVIIATESKSGTENWRRAFQHACPEVEFFSWLGDGSAVNARYAIVWRPPAGLFRHETGLRAVFNLGAGVDSLLALDGLPEQLPLVRLEDAGMKEQMADYVVHALLRASRQFDVYDAQQRAASWTPLPAIQRQDWPVGVMGMGAIGSAVATAVAARGYAVAGWARRAHDLPEVESYSGAAALPAFLARTRVLVNVLPLTGQTENILNRKNLGQLLPGALLINVGRGQHLVEQDLLDTLDSGAMDAAVLDVFRTEPLPAGHSFWNHPKVTVTPHISAITVERDAIDQIVGKIRDLEQDRPVSGMVSKASGY